MRCCGSVAHHLQLDLTGRSVQHPVTASSWSRRHAHNTPLQAPQEPRPPWQYYLLVAQELAGPGATLVVPQGRQHPRHLLHHPTVPPLHPVVVCMPLFPWRVAHHKLCRAHSCWASDGKQTPRQTHQHLWILQSLALALHQRHPARPLSRCCPHSQKALQERCPHLPHTQDPLGSCHVRVARPGVPGCWGLQSCQLREGVAHQVAAAARAPQHRRQP
mmetsp:Transcript_16128/g.44041  ORF Transcript_16128/g.44041 Transcript_16128/m.44041 type:complete len:217 (-) Transcript_16128:1162-1812(-)